MEELKIDMVVYGGENAKLDQDGRDPYPHGYVTVQEGGMLANGSKVGSPAFPFLFFFFDWSRHEVAKELGKFTEIKHTPDMGTFSIRNKSHFTVNSSKGGSTWLF